MIHTASKKIRNQILQEHNDAVCILKKVVTDIGHFEVQGVTFQRNWGGGGGKYQNILATIDRVCWVGEGYLWIQDLTRNMLRHSGKHKIYPRDKLSATREADSSKS